MINKFVINKMKGRGVRNRFCNQQDERHRCDNFIVTNKMTGNGVRVDFVILMLFLVPFNALSDINFMIDLGEGPMSLFL